MSNFISEIIGQKDLYPLELAIFKWFKSSVDFFKYTLFVDLLSFFLNVNLRLIETEVPTGRTTVAQSLSLAAAFLSNFSNCGFFLLPQSCNMSGSGL